MRSFLFLQGPLSPFFSELGRALIARGHSVHRVDLHLGEQIFWRLPASRFRGRFDEWRDYIGAILDEHRVTDMIMVGDRRPYHLVAAEEARARGIAVICTDFGYLRPGWVTFEYDGMTTYSRFPRDPAAIRELAAGLPEPDFHVRFNAPFRLVAALDVAFTVPQVLGRPFYPHYRWHGIHHPFAEYAGWLAALVRRRLTRPRTKAAKAELQGDPGSYFLFPLQLATDFQLRANSPFADAREAVRHVVESFAASGSQKKLVAVVHPLDNGLMSWRRLIRRLAREGRVEDRVSVLEDGIPNELLCHAAGIVTVNSTTGITALYHGIPVKVLGNAIYDIPGLTHQGRLDEFWHAPTVPDPILNADFLRALAGTTQVPGGFHTAEAKSRAIAGMVERLETGLYPLPALSNDELAARRPRRSARTIVVTGAADGIGLALARAYAEPGARLCLVGGSAESLATAAGDCIRRGAQVDTLPGDLDDTAATIEKIEYFDRHAPVDLILAQATSLDLFAGLNRLLDRMRLRERGHIAVIGALAGRAELAGQPDLTAGEAGLLAYAKSLRRHEKPSKVGVSIVRASMLATQIIRRGGDPRLVATGTDRAAAYIRRSLERGRPVIAVPGAPTVAWRAVKSIPAWLIDLPRRAVERIAKAAGAGDKASLSHENTQGD
ncbi:MAG TPA: SDR family NAD(P)-dependent oxidoreductase [Stellaceae bacterium]|nr:SDR family NAD(P)-dependent oxidoreductase [Stellaceae bacterium]